MKLSASEESFVTAENARSPPGFAGPPGFVKPSENDKAMKSEDRVAEWIKANNTEDDLPDLESPFDAETEEEEDTGIGKSNTRCSSMTSSTIGSEGYHSFGAAQVSHQQHEHFSILLLDTEDPVHMGCHSDTAAKGGIAWGKVVSLGQD